PTPRPVPSSPRSRCGGCTAARPPRSPPPSPAASACPSCRPACATKDTTPMRNAISSTTRPRQPHAAPHEPSRRMPLAPAWGWPITDGGRAVHASAGPEYQGTTTQLCGLYPFVAGSGAPTAGTPVGRHQLWGEVVCLDPLAWLRAGLVTNPGVFVLGQPGTAKSALVKRLVTGAVAFGTQALTLGATKPACLATGKPITPRSSATWAVK